MIRAAITTTAAALGAAALLATAPTAAAAGPLVAMPGMPIYQHDGDEGTRCTLGYGASNAYHDQLAVTAGHCGTVGGTVRNKTGHIIGKYVAVQPDNVAAHSFGYSIIKLRDTVATSAAITRSMELERQAQAQAGDHVCMFGTTSGRKCGTVTDITPQVGNIEGFLSEHGDSGGPIVRMTDHALVGILVAHNANQGRTYFEPIANINRLTAASGAGGPAFGAVIGN